MLNNYTLSFCDEEFSGLKFRTDLNFTDEYFSGLLEEGSHYSETRYADSLDKQTLEAVHIKLSYALVLKFISVISIIVAIILYFIEMKVPSVILIVSGTIMLLFNIYLTHKSNELCKLRETTRAMVKMMFENRE
jgi:hypothetical protein